MLTLEEIERLRLQHLQHRMRAKALLALNKARGQFNKNDVYYQVIKEGCQLLADIEQSLMQLDEEELRIRGYDPECIRSEIDDIDISGLLNECL